ncbi:MAG: ATP-binding cassette domain-containing protein [Lachnospiraceae bacterium]|nr:ATP-binding cassette domain-containing protein [Lachnospiraceae bacterium]
MNNETLIQVKGLRKYFETPRGFLHAVDNVSFDIKRGETLGVVGESGCGKSTLGRLLLRLIDATKGEVFFEDKNIIKLSRKEMRSLRKDCQLIFQDPYASLDPRMSVGEIIGEPLIRNKLVSDNRELENKVMELMDTVGLSRRLYNTYPHELDGGRRQRIGVARAISVNPKFIVCDEPVSALDVSIQAQILNLLMDLQDEKKFTYMFITHDLSVVKHISDEIMVMYLGQVVEKAPSDNLFEKPMHCYTKALLSAIPSIQNRHKKKEIIRGEITSPINPSPGCRFAARCEYAVDKCFERTPLLKEYEDRHFVACHRCRELNDLSL